MRRKLAAIAAMALISGLATVALVNDASARGGGGGHGGGGARASSGGGGSFSGGRASFSGGGFKGGAAFSGGGGSARIASGPRFQANFVGVRPAHVAGYVNSGRGFHNGKRGHRHNGGYSGYYGYGYGYTTFVSGYAYNSCGWLRARYEDTGLRTWRLRYQACINGDDY